MEKVGSSKIALIDYNSFDSTSIYMDSINELTDILFRRQYEVYALIGTDTNKPIPAIDAYISGIIPYKSECLTNSGNIISKNIFNIIKSIKEEDILIISSNPILLSTVEQFGYKVCLINNGHNDIVTLSGDEINHIKKINKILK